MRTSGCFALSFVFCIESPVKLLRGFGTAVDAGPDRVERRVTATIFVVAAGAVETARLLLRSPSRAFPDGFANRSGRVGTFLHLVPLRSR